MPDKNIRILVVDDFSSMRKIIKNVLLQLGYERIDEAGDGQSAMESMRAAKFDLVVSDWNMPVKTGLDLFRDMRADPELKDVPFLMVTAYSEKDHVLEAVQAGVTNYVLKPFSPKVMEERLAAIFPDRLTHNRRSD